METESEKPKRVLLQFLPFSSMIDASFWHELSRLKLEKFGLNETPIDISVSFHPELNSTLPSLVNINYEAFLPFDEISKKRQLNPDHDDFYQFGQLMVLNTHDDFASRDKRQLIIDAGKTIWESISDVSRMSEVDANLELHLSRFLMIVFADLKKYAYHYWCAFPAFNYPPRCFKLGAQTDKLQNYFSTEQLCSLLTEYAHLKTTDRLYFVVVLKTDQNLKTTVAVQTFAQFWTKENIDSFQDLTDFKVFFTFTDPSPSTQYPGWPMRNYITYLYVRLAQLTQRYPNDRNVTNFVIKSMFSPALRILSFRLRLYSLRGLGTHDQQIVDKFVQESSIYQIVFGSASGNKLPSQDNSSYLATSPPDALYSGVDSVDNAGICLKSFFEPVAETLSSQESKVPPIVGWERNPQCQNRLEPKFVDCSRQLDPKILSLDAVHLNLKLMKWRLVPEIDLDIVKNARCLLLGAGTLGCNIARSLMAWGVSKITFVDNGFISFSNPVRQTLYTFKDAQPQSEDGKPKPKAEAAAEALRLIYPGIDSEGIMLPIPMPGHSVAPQVIKSTESDIKRLEKLIEDHDVIFLLMDTRESRWLPTLIAASQHKTVINVALGFDTFLVQRHGIRFRPENEVDRSSSLFHQIEPNLELIESINKDEKSHVLLGNQLGCYYCNDVFAPGNSTRDRTLDQQCTVTRPGISMIASGYAVELLASLLQHPAKSFAPAITTNTSSAESVDQTLSSNTDHELFDPESILGLVPHQIRGFISRLEQITPSYKAFDSCTACSFKVIDKYRQEGFGFLLQVFNDSSLLEDITGLKKYHEIDDIDNFDFDDEEEFGETD